jgi:hypothetical protein
MAKNYIFSPTELNVYTVDNRHMHVSMYWSENHKDAWAHTCMCSTSFDFGCWLFIWSADIFQRVHLSIVAVIIWDDEAYSEISKNLVHTLCSTLVQTLWSIGTYKKNKLGRLRIKIIFLWYLE